MQIFYRFNGNDFVINVQQASLVMFVHEKQKPQHLQMKKFIMEKKTASFRSLDEMIERQIIVFNKKEHSYSLTNEGIMVAERITNALTGIAA